jgi:hypothetical protein
MTRASKRRHNGNQGFGDDDGESRGVRRGESKGVEDGRKAVSGVARPQGIED